MSTDTEQAKRGVDTRTPAATPAAAANEEPTMGTTKQISIEEAENMLLGLYEDETEFGDGSFFVHIGLPPDSTWEQFFEHYADRGGPSSERVGHDLATYPPIARRIAEVKAERVDSNGN